MAFFPHFPFLEEIYGMDFFLLAIIVAVLVFVVTIGPDRQCYMESVASMFRGRSSDKEISYPSIPFIRGIFVFLASCSSFGLMLCSIEGTFTLENGRGLIIFGVGTGFAALFYMLKILLYSSVNGYLFNRQAITVKPSRWNGFFNMLFTVSGVLFLAVTLIITFLGLPRPYSLILACLVPVFVETGIFYRLKSVLFKNMISVMGFFFYLCALEFSPLALAIPVLMRVMCNI